MRSLAADLVRHAACEPCVAREARGAALPGTDVQRRHAPSGGTGIEAEPDREATASLFFGRGGPHPHDSSAVHDFAGALCAVPVLRTCSPRTLTACDPYPSVADSGAAPIWETAQRPEGRGPMFAFRLAHAWWRHRGIAEEMAVPRTCPARHQAMIRRHAQCDAWACAARAKRPRDGWGFKLLQTLRDRNVTSSSRIVKVLLRIAASRIRLDTSRHQVSTQSKTMRSEIPYSFPRIRAGRHPAVASVIPLAWWPAFCCGA